MNRLELEPYRVSGWIEPAVRILIDGVDLVERVHAVELPFAKQEGHEESAGAYAGLPVSEIAKPSERFLGKDQLSYLQMSEKIALLVCPGCGEEGCWALLAEIEVLDNRIIWRDFEQPHRPEWTLSSLGPFVFERADYEAAIAELGARHA